MRPLPALILIASFLCASSALAEQHTFVIANNADGYGVDRCLASGAHCGAAAAAAYCKSREFIQAASFSKVDKDDVTGATSAGPACTGAGCDQLVAIVCTR